MSCDYDVVVVGGGLVGLSTALLLDTLSSGEYRIGIIEARPPKSISFAAGLPEVGLRVSALSPSSVAILNTIGVWPQVAAQRATPFTGMRVWHSGQPLGPATGLEFSAASLGLPELGFIVENDLLRRVLWDRAVLSAGITLLPPSAPKSVAISETEACLGLTDNSTVSAELLVAADGANSALRQLLGVVNSVGSYGQQGIVAHIAPAKSHQHIAWQRFLPAGPVALLPLQDGRCSLVWSCDNVLADELLALADTEFSSRLSAATEGVLGELRCVSPRVAFPLAYAHAEHYTGSRFALVGDAAHRIHPLAGQGVNLGLLDAAALAETLLSSRGSIRADAGDALVLRRYARWRRRDNELTLGMMNLLHRLFAGNPAESEGGIAKLAGRGLGLLNSIEPLKRRFAEHAVGRGRDLPTSARPQ
jgi:2-polyprenylphenol 6-hydroxylase